MAASPAFCPPTMEFCGQKEAETPVIHCRPGWICLGADNVRAATVRRGLGGKTVRVTGDERSTLGEKLIIHHTNANEFRIAERFRNQ